MTGEPVPGRHGAYADGREEARFTDWLREELDREGETTPGGDGPW